jgi:hypothetical protein
MNMNQCRRENAITGSSLSLSLLVLTSAPLCPEYVAQFGVHVIQVPSTPPFVLFRRLIVHSQANVYLLI